MSGRRRSWGIPVLLATAILTIIMLIVAILSLRSEEEDYEYLLDRRDKLQDELIRLKIMKLEGRISEKEYREISKKYLREIKRIEEKLEKIEKRGKSSRTF
ncbi:MAG: hypothetical protein DRJ38_03855 [Thermoprotei archaeon]|nr:MAG: hypothetical protein DRJ38_03855 [Thermoprotei archaeon]